MHYHPRHLEDRVRRHAGFFKVVALLGARQVGKSTLLRHLYPRFRSITFDPVQDRYDARRDPDLFLKNFPPPLILDEIQYAPELIPAIKRFVDENDAPGQFLITGSQNISVLNTISESLAGRVGIVTLHPMTGAEMYELHQPNPGWLATLLETGEMAEQVTAFPAEDHPLTRFLWRGTMPGLLTAPDDLVPAFFESYITTYIERDIRNMEEIRRLQEFSRFVRLCAALTAQEINASQLGRETGISPQTAQKWLNLLRLSFQWFELDPYHGNTIKRISGKKKGHFTDTGLACALQHIPSPQALLGHPSLGALFETMAVNAVMRLVSLMETKPALYHWRTVGGAEVDLVLEYNRKLFPMEMKATTRLSGHDARGLSAFRDTYPGRSAVGVILYAGEDLYRLREDVWAVPWNAV